MKTVPAFPTLESTLKNVFARARIEHPSKSIQGLIRVSATHAVMQCRDGERLLVSVAPDEAKSLGWMA